MGVQLRRVLLIFLVLSLAACARAVPKISHVHIGHTVSGWRDTPNQQGLFVTAEQEALNAEKEIKAAAASIADPAVAKSRVRNLLFVLDPQSLPAGTEGPGSGYGLKLALERSANHIQFAMVSDDASDNVKTAGANYVRKNVWVLEQCDLAISVASLVLESANQEEIAALVQELLTIVSQIHTGPVDSQYSAELEQLGIKQLRKELSTIINGESDPPYHPIGRRYLLGLVKLPNGNWAFNFDAADPNQSEPGGGGGY